MVIEAEIKKQTENLFHALESKKILLKELHHRIKNNLQLILSIVRMQTGSVESSLKNQFVDLANRIIAISKTHEMLRNFHFPILYLRVSLYLQFYKIDTYIIPYFFDYCSIYCH